MSSFPRSPARLSGAPSPVDAGAFDDAPTTYAAAYVATRTPARGVPAVRRAARPGPWPDASWPAEAADEPVIDFGQLRELLGFPWRAVRRRRRLAGGVFGAVFGAALLALLVVPRQYFVETSILAQRNFVMPALGNPRRAVPAESDAPTRMAAEAVLNRENLLALADEVKLEEAWPRLRPPLGRAKDAVRALVAGPTPADEHREQLVGYLRGQLWVVADEGTVRIGITLADPRLALRVVQLAQRNFLETRNASEQALIRESIGILEGHVRNAHAQIEGALADVRQFTPAAAAGGARNLAAGLAPARAAAPNPAAAQLESDLSAKRAAIAAAEAARAQRAGALQARLDELRRTVGPAHPELVATQQALEALAGESPDVAALRRDERALAAQVAAAGGSPAAGAARGEATLTAAALARLAAPPAAGDTLEDPRLTYARSRLKIAVADHEDLLDRLEGARIELETARAAFKYRYNVITPALLPRRPVRPNVPLLLVGGLVAAVGLAAFAALAVDLAGGRVVERWQVSRAVGLPVLGELPRP
jgi:uncharacterized protein involved in exopolysaccharide biosynthesis